MTIARGIRNNNPGNLRPGPLPWLGQTGVDDGGYCVFDTPEHGIRALALQLVIYQDRHGCNTVRQVIMRWAPPSENDTGAYIAAVAEWIGVDPDQPIDLHAQLMLATITTAIIQHEVGPNDYTLTQIDGGTTEALV